MVRSLQSGVAPSKGAAAEAQRDLLLPLLGSSATSQDLAARIQEDGYVVIPGVISRAEADAELDRMWGFVERVSPTVNRADPASWYTSDSGLDPWPVAQREMFQLHQAGWLFSDLREKVADAVFAELYGTPELHVSKDGFTFFRPTEAQVKTTPNDHFDQGLGFLGLHCIQGSMALTDQEENDGCFMCWPGSHLHREDVLATLPPSKAHSDFIMLGAKEKAMLRERGIEPRRVPVSKGDVILWRSDLLHCGAPPIGPRPNFRAVVYICCLPAALTPDEVYADKVRAYQELQTGCHWPCREEWFQPRVKHMAIGPRPYFRTLPQLNERQQQLYGLVRYNAAEEAQEASAEARRRWRPKAKPTA